MRMSRLFRYLFRRRQPSKVGSYIDAIPTIEKLIRKDLLYVDAQHPLVVLSAQLHLAYMDDEAKLSRWPYRKLLQWGLIERDRRYRALMEHLLAYVNYRRGAKGMAVVAPHEPLYIQVMNLDISKPVLLGVYQHGRVEYKPCL